MRTSTCLLPKVQFLLVVGVALMVCQVQSASAQDDGGVVPAAFQGSSSFFHKQLGTALRASYHTQGYGTQDDVFSIGGMKVMPVDDVSTVFIDGQGTLSDDFGGGFNLGVGYRQLTNSTSPIMSIDPERIIGFGFWTDGQSTAADNFFTQLGFSLESLGESFDTRLTGQFPLERSKEGDATLTGFGTPTFQGNNLFGATEAFTLDTALTVIDSEFAKRLGDLDAWAYVAGYHLDGGVIDTDGYRAGVRGYAVPDLLLSLQVTDDNLYKTNVMFGITWFIGRTHRGNMPCGTIMDRMREPVLRNDFIAINSAQGTRASGNALTGQGTTTAVDIVHIDSSAPDGGDGSFENPYNELADIDAMTNPTNSRDGSIILVHGGSTLNGSATLQDNQRFLGEGLDETGNAITHVVDTNELGVISMPETAAGAQGLSQIVINGTGDVLTLANGNTVNNFEIEGGDTAVRATGSDAPTLQNLNVDNSTGDAIVFTNVTGTGVIENTVTVEGAAGRALHVDGGDSDLALAPTITNTVGNSLLIENRTGGTLTMSGTVDDTGQGVRVADNTGGSILFTNDLTLNTGTDNAVDLSMNTGATITFNGLDIDTTSGIGFNATGGGTIAATGTNNIDTTTGTGLNLNGMTIDAANMTFDAVNVTNGAGSGINLQDLDGTGGVTVNGGTLTTAGTAIDVNNAPNASFDNVTVENGATAGAGVVVRNNTTGSVGFQDVAVRTRDQAAVNINMNSGGTTGFTNLTADSTAGGQRAVDIQDNTGGTVNVTTATIASTTGEGLFVDGNSNTTTLDFSGLDVDTTSGDGIELGNTDAATATFTGFDVNAATSGRGFVSDSNGTISGSGTNDVTTNTGVGVEINGTTIAGTGLSFSSVNVTNGGSNGVVLSGTTGGQIRVGAATATGTDGDGGTLNTMFSAISLTGVTNAVFNDVTVNATNSSAVFVNHNSADASNVAFDNLSLTTQAGAGNGISLNDNGTGELDFTLQNSVVDSTASGAIGFQFATGANSGENDIRIQGSTITAADNNAVSALISQGSGDVQFLLSGNNVISNNSAANAAANFSVTAARTLNATIGKQSNDLPFDENSFTNANAAGTAFAMEVNNAAGNINLDLRGNEANGGALDFELLQTNGDFGVVERTDTITNGTNNADPIDIGGGVEADFDDLVPPIKQVD